MKKYISIFVSACVVYTLAFQTACIGSFGLTNMVYTWNKDMNKWLGELVFLVFVVLPVYGISLMIDVVILNLIEFWTGSNPISMKDGETDRQLLVGTDGNTYEVTASKNRFDVVTLSGAKAGETSALIFNPENRTWNQEKNCVLTPLFQYSESGDKVKLFGPEGKMAVLPAGISDRELATQMVKSQFDSQICVN